ncbi:MAG: PilZ domain-containing protein [Kordiimonadaceae bacterium]|nr:PilZ domain-containing protein [Kordiimonadaceae bacterium]MBO6568792.1 PilZ domain-containing protein [Kordiimonadaceae bacterium]MBO6965233.1 PilZ domain-containing protein [Kordiimonadaceae bacterium]
MADSEKRGDDRLPVLWTGKLTTDDDREFSCKVRDVSLAGTLISTDADIAMGERLLLEIEELGEFAVEVKWSGSEQLGLLILAGPDLALKKFAEGSGASPSEKPQVVSGDPLAS